MLVYQLGSRSRSFQCRKMCCCFIAVLVVLSLSLIEPVAGIKGRGRRRLQVQVVKNNSGLLPLKKAVTKSPKALDDGRAPAPKKQSSSSSTDTSSRDGKHLTTFPPREDFTYSCLVELTKDASKGFLSQDDYATFLYEYCSKSPLRGPSCDSSNSGKKLDFVAFPIDIQLVFVKSQCPFENPFAKMVCLDDLLLEGRPFLYTEEIEELCQETLSLLKPNGLLQFPDTAEDLGDTAPTQTPVKKGDTSPLDQSSEGASLVGNPDDAFDLGTTTSSSQHSINEDAQTLTLSLVLGGAAFGILVLFIFASSRKQRLQKILTIRKGKSDDAALIEGDESILSENTRSLNYGITDSVACTSGLIDWVSTMVPTIIPQTERDISYYNSEEQAHPTAGEPRAESSTASNQIGKSCCAVIIQTETTGLNCEYGSGDQNATRSDVKPDSSSCSSAGWEDSTEESADSR